MIYSVSIYNKNGKLKKTISPRTLLQRHWKQFYKRERTPKRFVMERVKAEQQELLRKYQRINNISDELYCEEDNS